MTGGSGSDVFGWRFADGGTAGTPARDTITDFNLSAVSAGGDVLDLRDLLVGENTVGGTGNLQNYIDFDTTTTSGTTIVRISSTGGFANGVYDSTQETQRITLTGVDVRTGLGLTSTATDAEVIAKLLTANKLIVDNT